MRLVVNIVLVLVAIGLAYVLFQSISEPIAFNAERTKRTDAVVNKLRTVKTCQEFYRDITGSFAGDFDTLAHVLRNDSFAIVKVIGDPDDPNFTGEITYDTTFSPAYDTIRALAINLDSLPYVPYGSGATFNVIADTITYQGTNVNVVEVGTKYSTFMGKYASKRFARYDQRYNPNATLKFGDLNSPKLNGNWE